MSVGGGGVAEGGTAIAVGGTGVSVGVLVRDAVGLGVAVRDPQSIVF